MTRDTAREDTEKFQLTCVCGWSESRASLEFLEGRAVTHGMSSERHKWTITAPDGEVIDRGQ